MYKSVDKSERVNYLHISLISSLAKVLETVIKKRLVNYLEKYNILLEYQYGFRDARSTQDAIELLTQIITR